MINHTIVEAIKFSLVFESANPSIFPIVGLKEMTFLFEL